MREGGIVTGFSRPLVWVGRGIVSNFFRWLGSERSLGRIRVETLGGR